MSSLRGSLREVVAYNSNLTEKINFWCDRTWSPTGGGLLWQVVAQGGSTVLARGHILGENFIGLAQNIAMILT